MSARRRTIAKFTGRDGESVAAVLTPALSVNLLVVSPKGTITKQRYYAEARLTRELRRYRAGATIGNGPYKIQTGTSPVGAECSVYGVARGIVDKGEDLVGFTVALPGGGFSTTGRSKSDDPVEIEITEEPAREALELAREALVVSMEEKAQADEQRQHLKDLTDESFEAEIDRMSDDEVREMLADHAEEVLS